MSSFESKAHDLVRALVGCVRHGEQATSEPAEAGKIDRRLDLLQQRARPREVHLDGSLVDGGDAEVVLFEDHAPRELRSALHALVDVAFELQAGRIGRVAPQQLHPVVVAVGHGDPAAGHRSGLDAIFEVVLLRDARMRIVAQDLEVEIQQDDVLPVRASSP